jgi:acetyltransferase-like isoleucine patch superfamily enzyme
MSAALPPTRPTLRHRRARRARRHARIEGLPLLGRGVVLDVEPGAEVVLGDGCVLMDGCRIHARGGIVRIAPGAVLGERCVLIAHAGIEVGEHARLADEVALIDFAPEHRDSETPTRLQGLRAAPIHVGARALIGPRAALEPGARVPAGAVVPPRAVTQ